MAGKLAARSVDVARASSGLLANLCEVVAADRPVKADHLLENVLDPLSAKGIALPGAVLEPAQRCAPRGTGVPARVDPRAPAPATGSPGSLAWSTRSRHSGLSRVWWSRVSDLHATVVVFSNSIGVSMPRLLWRRWRLWKISR